MIVSSSHTIHLHSPLFTLGWTVLESLQTLIYGVCDIDKMAFEKYLRSVFRGAFQRLPSWGIPGEYFVISRPGEIISRFSPARFEVLFCGVVLVCGCTNQTFEPCIRGASFLARGVLACNLSYFRSVAVLCVLCKIASNHMHPLCGALPAPFVPVRVIRGALVTHWYSKAPPRCRTSQYRKTSIPILLTRLLWDDLVDSVFDDVVLSSKE